MGRKAPARVRKSLLGSLEKSFLTKSSNIVTTAVDASRYDVNIQPMANFTEQPAPLQKQASFLQDVLSISPPGFPQFAASTPQLVISNQPLTLRRRMSHICGFLDCFSFSHFWPLPITFRT